MPCDQGDRMGTRGWLVVGLIVMNLDMSADALSCSANRFGRDCAFTCHCLNYDSCDVTTGRCPRGCAPSWDGDSCQRENIVYNRETRQKDGKEPVNQSSLAVDDDATSCSMTKPAVPGWWSVTMENTTVVQTVKIMAGEDANINGWKIYAGIKDKIFSMSLCATVRFHGTGALLQCDKPIISKYVMIVNRIGPVSLCDVGVYACSRFWFGTECNKACNCANPNEVCDVESGACASGCQVGWSGNDCQTGCRNHFGENCKFPCGKCDGNMSCNKTNGACPTGCQEGWRGKYCTQECGAGRYGKNCDELCENCHGDGSCDSVTGRCHYGCLAGYMGDTCELSCPKGSFGENCNFKCNNCADGMGCDPETGECLGGCLAGWEGVFCTQECLPGFYGPDCRKSCDTCLNGNCDKVTGQCLSGCAAGFIGDNCSQICESGKFGLNCSETCGKCSEGEGHLCHVTNGTCLHGCQFAYSMPLCNNLCPPGYFGEGCEKCGMCTPPSKCDVFTGKCPDGCGLDFYGDRCMQSDPFTDENGPQLAIFLGFMITIVALMMLVVTVCLIMVWQREELADITKKPGIRSTPSVHDISAREQNGFLVRNDEDEDEDEDEDIDYV